jgi:ureidoacrylate peracid hydrolase
MPNTTVVIPAEPEPISIDIGRTAVIVVDMQNSFCKKGGMMDRFGKLDIPQAEQVTIGCRAVVRAARRNGMPVVYLRMTYGLAADAAIGPDSPFYWKEKGLAAMRRNPDLKGRFLTPGTRDWQIIDELEPEPGDVIIDKSRYSGFVNTDLDAVLRANDIRCLLFVGLYTNICVESTLRDAFSHGYFCVLVRDACGNIGADYLQDATISNVQATFGWVTTTTDITNSLA